MMKIKLLILTIISLNISCTQEVINKLEKTWILVNQSPIDEDTKNWGMTSFDGMLLHFEDEIFKTTHVFSNGIVEHKYKLTEGYIKNLDNDTFSLGKIVHLSDDSLVIQNDKLSGKLHFNALSNNEMTNLKLDEIYNKISSNIWELKDENYYRFYCDTMSWRGSFTRFNDLSKLLYYDEDNRRIGYKRVASSECWGLKEFQGKLLFVFTTSEADFNYFNIINITRNKIIGEFKERGETTWRTARLQQKVKLNTQKYKELKSELVGKWQLTEVNEPKEILTYKDSLHLIHNYEEPYYESRLKINDFKENQIWLILNEKGEYIIKGRDRIIRKGKKWNISQDGRFLYLDSQFNEENFFEIIELSNNKITFDRHEKISLNEKRPIGYARIRLMMTFKKI